MMLSSTSFPITEQVFVYSSLFFSSWTSDVAIVYLESDYSKRDKNGLNPLELSMKKNQLKAEW
jgi:hypothetical protein